MSNLIDYIKWRGDLSLEEFKFNEVDNLALTRLSYFPLESLMKEEEEISIKELAERFKKKNINVKVPGSKSITNRALMLAAISDSTCKLSGVLFSDDSRAFLFARTGLFVLCGRLELCLRMSKKFICMFFLKKRGICCLTQNIINKRYFVILWRACL